MDAIVPTPGETEKALAARVLARALDEEIDIRDMAARLWEAPAEATDAEVQIMGAYIVAKDGRDTVERPDED